MSLGHVIEDRNAFPLLADHVELADDQRDEVRRMRFVTLVVGEFDVVRQEWEGVPMPRDMLRGVADLRPNATC